MRKLISRIFLIVTLIIPYSAQAILNMELTQGVAGAIPIAVVPFSGSEGLPQDVSGVISQDLQNSGRFKVYDRHILNEFPSSASAVSAEYFKHLGTDNVVVGKITPAGEDKYKINFELVNLYESKGSQVLNRSYTVSGKELRSAAHHISDLIYEEITGVRGVFSTKIAYVVVQRPAQGQARYILEVSDQDGYNPRPLLNSPEPIMSPDWSPNGKQIAYVSFENRKASIYIQDVASGNRRLLSEFPGINGAPAWSPDGRKLALVLSKSGSPNIYVMDVASKQLTQLTNDYYINTEPSWSPDGKSLLFTSTRGGGPQIYQVSLGSHAVNRISFDGDYNARASYTSDGRHIAMIHKASGVYSIAILDLDNGTTKVLSGKALDSASPSIAPNNSMILYDTFAGNRNVLAMVSADGSVQVRLPARNGEAQDPAWSPFLG